MEDLGGGTIRVDVKSKTAAFKARPVPSTNAVPSIKPRMSRAAALRAGMDVPTMRSRPSATRESIANTFANVPGHKRATVSSEHCLSAGIEMGSRLYKPIFLSLSLIEYCGRKHSTSHYCTPSNPSIVNPEWTRSTIGWTIAKKRCASSQYTGKNQGNIRQCPGSQASRNYFCSIHCSTQPRSSTNSCIGPAYRRTFPTST